MRYISAIGTLAGATLLGSSAFAADLYEPAPVYDPVVAAAPVFTWTGAYIGGHIGWAWASRDFSLNNDEWGFEGANASLDSDGFIGGGQVGYWWQTNNVVWGFDLSGSWADLSASTGSPDFVSDTWSTGLDWFVLAQARVGYAAGRWLPFIQGGYAGAQASASASFGGFSVENDGWANGWTVGTGVLYKATQQVSLGLEYNYVDLGSQSYSLVGQGVDVDRQIHVVKGTINFHFN